MKLAISNIAWDIHNDPLVLNKLRELHVTGIEVAPTKVWPDWTGSNQKNAEIYKKKLIEEGFQIPAMQAILFGKPSLQLFDKNSHNAFIEHIKHVSDIAAGFGAKVLVFGAPKNRKRGQLSTPDSLKMAADVLYKAGEICHGNNCCIGLEHNPVEYGCDFITNAADARLLVNNINHPGVQLHIDSAGLHMCGGNISDLIQQNATLVHYHISEPMLEPVVDGVVDHKTAIQTLENLQYSHWYSIEMKQPKSLDLVFASVSKAVSFF